MFYCVSGRFGPIVIHLLCHRDDSRLPRTSKIHNEMAIFDQKLVKTGRKQGDCGKNSSFFEKISDFFLQKTRLTDSQWPKTCPKCKNSEKISGKFFPLRALKELDFGSGLCRFFDPGWLRLTKNRQFLTEKINFRGPKPLETC